MSTRIINEIDWLSKRWIHFIKPPGSNGHNPHDPSLPRRGQIQPHRDPKPGNKRSGDQDSTEESNTKRNIPRFLIIVLLLMTVNFLIVQALFPGPQQAGPVAYSFFVQQVEAGNVAEITSQGDTIRGEFVNPVLDPNPPEGVEPTEITQFQTEVPTFVPGEQLNALLTANNVTIRAQPVEQGGSILGTLLLAFGPVLLLVGLFVWFSMRMARRAGGDIMGLGRSRAKRYNTETNTNSVTFADVAGIDEVKSELIEIVDFLRNPDKYQRLGGTIPRGVLLVGPPGTGKTLLARATAGEANAPFFSMSGSEFIEMIVGVGAARVRDLFAEAKKSAPAIIFVDELDAIGRKRGAQNMMGGNDEREQTLNQLLTEMDGFDGREAVIVIAATNRADVLDPALLRPGRFDRRIAVQPSDRTGRRAILQVHTRSVPLAPDVDLDMVAAETPGLSGAELRNLVNEAALHAARNGRDAVTQIDFALSLERIALGAERNLTLQPEERRRIAFHEAGHALLGLLQPESDPVRRVTVVPRGQALGVTLSVPEADRYNYSEPYLRARIINALGGRAAEQIIYNSVTTGAENDLKQVTDVARAMVTRWGMSREVGLLSLTNDDMGADGMVLPGTTQSYSDKIAERVDDATRRIIDECYAQAITLLTENRDRLEALTEALLREESLDEAQMRAAT